MDLNIVATESGKLVEVQAASEGTPFSLEELDALVRLGCRGIREIIEAARRSLAP